MSADYRRKKFFFKKSPQGRYIFSYFLITGGVAIFFTLLFICFSSDTLSITYKDNNLTAGSTPEILLDQLLGIHGILIFIFGFFIIFFATRFTHRIIGPLYKIEKTMDKMITGDINQQIFLRHKDDCKELAEKLNIFNTMLYSKLKETDRIVGEMKKALQNNQTPADSTGACEYLDLKHIKCLNERLETLLSYFDLSGDLPEKVQNTEQADNQCKKNRPARTNIASGGPAGGQTFKKFDK